MLRFGDDDTRNKSALDQVLICFFRGVRGGLLLFCVWLAFDPILGPRRLVFRQMNLALPLLTFDYLTALCAGFLAGNLLRFQALRNIPAVKLLSCNWRNCSNAPPSPLLTALLVVMVLGLGARNLPRHHPGQSPAAHAVRRTGLAQPAARRRNRGQRFSREPGSFSVGAGAGQKQNGMAVSGNAITGAAGVSGTTGAVAWRQLADVHQCPRTGVRKSAAAG